MPIFIQGGLFSNRINGRPIVDTEDEQTLTNKDLTDNTNRIRATQLATATGDVMIYSSAAPSAGDVLVAAGNLTATWEPQSGGLDNEFEYSINNSNGTTTGVNWVNKINWTTSSKTPGTYRINWYYEYNTNSINIDFLGQILLNGATVIHSLRHELSDVSGNDLGGNDQSLPCSGYEIVQFSTPGAHNIKLQYRSETAGYVAACRRAKLSIERLA